MIDGTGDHSGTDSICLLAKNQKLRILELKVATAQDRWSGKLPPRTFKSACSVMKALQVGIRALEKKSTDLLVISGKDFLRTGYTRAMRNKLMKIYSHKYTPMDGYTLLAKRFLVDYKISHQKFLELRDALFSNFLRTWKKINPDKNPPEARWFQPLNRYFRGVDCANPYMDFSGKIIIASQSIANQLGISPHDRLEIVANTLAETGKDGFGGLSKILPYTHLRRAFLQAEKISGLDFKKEFFNQNALLEVYTCYPIVPIAFLLKTGFVDSIDTIPRFLDQHEITLSGGLNLARAPWNNTTLNHTIAMAERLQRTETAQYGLIHGNSSLGYQQGLLLLKKPMN